MMVSEDKNCLKYCGKPEFNLLLSTSLELKRSSLNRGQCKDLSTELMGVYINQGCRDQF